MFKNLGSCGHDSLGFPLPEGASEEPGDEGSDGSDEEPAVGRQRHADAQEVTAPPETLLRHAFLHRQKDCIVAKPGETRESVCFVFFVRDFFHFGAVIITSSLVFGLCFLLNLAEKNHE